MPKKPLSENDVFTTGQAAKACHVSQQTIIRCFDSGQLKGFRVPGSRFRRIPRESLVKFMEDNCIPMDMLQVPDTEKQLHMLTTQELLEAVQQQSENGDITSYESSLDLGLSMQNVAGTLVVDGRVASNEDLSSIAAAVAKIRTETPEKLQSIGVLTKTSQLKGGSFDAELYTSNPDDVLAQKILEAHEGE